MVEPEPALTYGTHIVVVPLMTPPTRTSTYVMLVRLDVGTPELLEFSIWPTALTLVPLGAPVFTIAMPIVVVPAVTFKLVPPPSLVVTLPLLLPAERELLGGEFTDSSRDADCPTKVAVTVTVPAVEPTMATAQLPKDNAHVVELKKAEALGTAVKLTCPERELGDTVAVHGVVEPRVTD